MGDGGRGGKEGGEEGGGGGSEGGRESDKFTPSVRYNCRLTAHLGEERV